MSIEYPVPSLKLYEKNFLLQKKDIVRFEEEIKKSRFITTLAHADSRERALLFIEDIKKEFSDARHNCWAYAVGAPGDTARIGQSDDGEPHGTAGKPMLTQLLYSGIGELVAVTTRYFGGIKLGTGGLTKAYQNGVKNALLLLSTEIKKEYMQMTIEIPYVVVDKFYRIIQAWDGVIIQEDFSDIARFTLELPVDKCDVFKKILQEETSGKCNFM